MNNPRRGELHAYVASRFAAEDEARSKWLDERIEEKLRRQTLIQQQPRTTCARGHPIVVGGRCGACNAMRMRARRSVLKQADEQMVERARQRLRARGYAL